jgi:hypothetical protein
LLETAQVRCLISYDIADDRRRYRAAEAIKARGGKSPGSVSKKTFALVVGDEPGASKQLRRGRGALLAQGVGATFNQLVCR